MKFNKKNLNYKGEISTLVLMLLGFPAGLICCCHEKKTYTMFVNLLTVRIYDNTTKNPVLAKDTAKICLVLQMNREF